MAGIISELWYGNIEPCVSFGKENHKVRQLEKLIGNRQQKTEEILSDEGREMFEKYTEAVNEYISVVQQQSFCDGFALGTKLTAEAMVKAESVI